MKKIIKTASAPAPIGPYNQAVMAGDTIYISGQIAIDPATGNMLQDSIQEEAKQVMNNLKAILNEAGMDYANIVKTTIFLKTMNDFSAVNEVYASCFENNFPARETVAVAGLPKNANVEISVIAVKL